MSICSWLHPEQEQEGEDHNDERNNDDHDTAPNFVGTYGQKKIGTKRDPFFLTFRGQDPGHSNKDPVKTLKILRSQN